MYESGDAGRVGQVVAGCIVPDGYEIWADGVYTLTHRAMATTPSVHEELPLTYRSGRKKLCYRPLWISSLGFTVDTEEPLMQLTFSELNGNVKSVWLGRGQVTDHRMLGQLGAAGLPIDSVNAEGVLMYLRSMESLNGKTLPFLRVGHRSGPYLVDQKMGWLIGKQWIGDGNLEADPRLNAKYTLAFSPHGDANEWYAKWRELRDSASWVPRFLIGSTFAPPLLRMLKCRTFIVHHWGDSSHGKTATAVFALSAWGNPELLYSSLNRTAISLTEVFKHLTDLPVLFDEKQVSTVSSEELIYSICTGAGRERGAKDGGLRQDRQQWLTIARTTGEVPLVTNGDVGGQFNRVLQIHSKAFESKRQAESIYPFTAENFGHAGPAFLRQLAELLKAPRGVDVVRQLCAEMREALINRIGVDSNHCQYGAVIATAQTLAESWLLDIPVAEARERALDDATLAIKETAPTKQLSYAEKALSKLRDHWISNPTLYYDDTCDEGRERSAKTVYRMVGVEGVYGMAYIPHEANDILSRAGYGHERVWRDFFNNGWLVTANDSALTTLTLRGGKSPDHGVYCIKPEVFYAGEVARRPHLQLVMNNVVGLERS